MPYDTLNPSLNLILCEFIPGFKPVLRSFLPILWGTLPCSSSFKPIPSGLDHIEIRRIGTSKQPDNLMKVVRTALIPVIVCWGLIFLYDGIWTISRTLPYKREELW